MQKKKVQVTKPNQKIKVKAKTYTQKELKKKLKAIDSKTQKKREKARSSHLRSKSEQTDAHPEKINRIERIERAWTGFLSLET